jgi:hypothetical protein
MSRNILRDKEIRDAITAEQQAHLDFQEMLVPDPRGARIRKQGVETRTIVARLLAFAEKYNPFGSKKA